MSCNVDGHKRVSKHSMHLPKKLATTARSMERNSIRHSKQALSSKWRAVPQARIASEREIVLTHTMT